MTKEEAESKYLEYLEGHIGNVNKALDILSTLDIPFINDNLSDLKDIVKDHDASKYEEPEWSAYLHHFYPTNDEEAMMGEEFDLAVKHHINSNPHHWDYWLDDDNNLINDIDEREYKLYTVERICDWLAMAGQHQEGPTDYYEANKDFIIQPDYARELCDEVFPKVSEDYSKDMWKITRGELDEDFLPINKETVDSLGDRVKRSKTSNTIEIDTQMTNHDKQLKEMEVEHPKRPKDIIEYEYYNDNGEYVIDLKDGWEDPVGNNYIIERTKKEAYRILKQCVKVINKNLEEAALLEARASQLRNKTKSEDPARVKKSKNVKSTYIGMSKFGILNFKTTSESRDGYHYQTLEFQSLRPFEQAIKQNGKVTPEDIKRAMNDEDINVYCSDESFTYWAWYHQAYQNDYAYIDDNIPNLDKRLQAPKVNNVRLAGALCKHLYSVLEYVMKPFVLLAISDDMNKFLAGNKEDKMNKQDVATQNWYDAVKQWSSEDAQDYLGLTKQQILMDLSKSIKSNPTMNLDDYVDDLVDEAIRKNKTEVNPKLERLLIDKVKETLDLEQAFDEMKPEEEITNDTE